MVCLLLSLVACGDGAKPATSTPVPPTEDLGGTLPPAPQWSDLEGFFPPEPGLPLATPGLVPGMPLADAEARLQELALGRLVSREIEGHMVHTATLEKPPEVAVAVLSDLDKKTVEELQYTVPAQQAERALMELWGIPGGFTLEEEPSYLWTSDTLRIEWISVAGKSAGILTYSRPSPDETPP